MIQHRNVPWSPGRVFAVGTAVGRADLKNPEILAVSGDAKLS